MQGLFRVALAALLVAGGLQSAARAHDATDGPARAPEDSSHGVAAPGATTAAPPSLRPPLVLAGAGALTAGLGAWLLYDETHPKNSSCAALPPGYAQCTEPSSGPGIGMAMVIVGAQAAVLGLVWLAVRAHSRPAPVALELGPGTLALRGTF
jgi:hypothetical protein